MKILQFRLLSLMLLAGTFAKAQVEITGSLGTASYYGDLTAKNSPFSQASYAVSGGVNYQFAPKFGWRTEITYAKVQASDSKNSRADLKARNLSFKSGIWSINTSVEYDFVDLTQHRCTPYGFLGIGLAHFNPYTKDRNGNKQFLQPQGTEGQGLSAYPDRKPYKRTEIEIPMGIGVKYAINEKIIIGLEFKYHYMDTDYLDDVSLNSYPDPALLAAKDPFLPKLTYRGDELPGGTGYPTNLNLPRGNPNNRDIYYTTEVKVAFRLKSSKIQINY